MSSAAAPTAHHPDAPQPTIPAATPASPPNKRDLRSWWKTFTLPNKKVQENVNTKGIFGVPLRQSITYANVAISLVDENGQSYIYGYVPIVVAKCGVFLKERATTTEGIFRLSGSEKRIKELKNQFDSPDRYGKGLSWEGYTVHDAANVFRRYLNDLPEPVVPLDLYEKFREPLRGATKQAVGDADGPQFVDNFDQKAAIDKYQKLITELPPLNKQLLLYILDLLAVFAAKSDENRMTSQNLAAIFQPGMLSHPNHAMAPEEYRLNQCVIIFLIENQDHFLIGMQGTGTDEETRQIVESGAAAAAAAAVPLTPTVNTSGVVRSSSNASAGAHSVRREGQIRRNRSVNSRHSRQNDSGGPNSPALSASHTGSLGRSNTVPSKRSPAVGGSKFKRHDHSGPHSPAHLEPLTPAQPTETPRISEHSSLAPQVGAASVSAGPGRSQERLLEVPQDQSTPRKERQLQSLFNRSPTDEGKRQPNKLQKKRLPGSMNHSAHSSNTSLPQTGTAFSPSAEPTNPLDQPGPVSEAEKQQALDGSSDPTSREHQAPQTSTLHPESQLKNQKSPPTSLHSYQEGSDQDQGAENPNGSSNSEKEKKSKWRISRSAKKDDDHGIRSNENLGASQSSFASGSAGKPRKSFTGDHSDTGIVPTETHHSSSTEKEESRGPMKWIRDKVREAKERNKSPPPSDHGHASLAVRGKSFDVKRDQPSEKPQDPAPVAEKSMETVPEKPMEIVPEKPQEAAAEEPQAAVILEKNPGSSAQLQPSEAPIAEEPPTEQPETTAKPADAPEEQATSADTSPPAAAPIPAASSDPDATVVAAATEPQAPPVSSEPETKAEAKTEAQTETPKQA